MHKDLYNKDARLTTMGMRLDKETMESIEDVFKKYSEWGCNPRAISHVMISAIMEIESMTVLSKVVRQK